MTAEAAREQVTPRLLDVTHEGAVDERIEYALCARHHCKIVHPLVGLKSVLVDVHHEEDGEGDGEERPGQQQEDGRRVRPLVVVQLLLVDIHRLPARVLPRLLRERAQLDVDT